MSNQTATLIVYTANGVGGFKTNSYEDVLEFKRKCTEHGFEYSVRFSQDTKTNKEAHIHKPWYKKLFS